MPVEMYKNSHQPLKLLNLLFFAATIAVNALANILPFNGITTGEVSDKFRTLFAPAPVTFAIWGLIYLLLGIFVIYQMGWTSQGKRMAANVVSDVGALFLIASAANMAWIYFWHYQEMALTLLFMVVLLFSLMGIYLKLNDSRHERSGILTLMVDVPFRIYLGWVSVATIANVSAFLVSIEWTGLGLAPEIWTVIVIAVAALLGILFLYRYSDYFYNLVLIWAFAGIILQHRNYWQNAYTMIIYAAAAAIVVLVLFGIYIALGMKGRKRGNRYY
jgi:hypothetical protein